MEDLIITEKFMTKEVSYDPSLDAYTDVVFFPKKLALATELYKTHALPKKKKINKRGVRVQSRSKNLTNLQAELLSIYALNASEKQMLKLKDFLAQLFSNEQDKVESKEAEIAQ